MATLEEIRKELLALRKDIAALTELNSLALRVTQNAATAEPSNPTRKKKEVVETKESDTPKPVVSPAIEAAVSAGLKPTTTFVTFVKAAWEGNHHDLLREAIPTFDVVIKGKTTKKDALAALQAHVKENEKVKEAVRNLNIQLKQVVDYQAKTPIREAVPTKKVVAAPDDDEFDEPEDEPEEQEDEDVEPDDE